MTDRLRTLALIWRIEWRVWRHPISRHERRGWREQHMAWFGIPGFAACRIRTVEWDKHGLGLPPRSWADPRRGLIRKTLDLLSPELPPDTQQAIYRGQAMTENTDRKRACAYCGHSDPKWDIRKTEPRGRYLCHDCRRPDPPPTKRPLLRKTLDLFSPEPTNGAELAGG